MGGTSPAVGSERFDCADPGLHVQGRRRPGIAEHPSGLGRRRGVATGRPDASSLDAPDDAFAFMTFDWFKHVDLTIGPRQVSRSEVYGVRRRGMSLRTPQGTV